MRHLTVRNIPAEVGKALEKEKRRRGLSLNLTVIELLGQSLGLSSPRRKQNGLRKLAGTWTEEEFERFHQALTPTEQIDAELWE